MKKSVVVLIVVLAIVVLVSPGIVGRLAEKTMDENIDRAAGGSPDFIVTSRGFERGWFSSAGSHRVEIREGDLRELLVAIIGPDNPSGIPALIIDTQIDHGLIPLSSLGREKGSLAPGLGSAVSTMHIEFPGGDTVPVPGKVYSHVGVTGVLVSNYLLDAGQFQADGGTLSWGRSDIVVTSNPANGALGFRGQLEPVVAASDDGALRIEAASFDLRQLPSRFGIPVGSVAIDIDALEIVETGLPTRLGPLALTGELSADGDDMAGSLKVSLGQLPTAVFGPGRLIVEMRVDDLDGAAFGRLNRSLRDVIAPTNPDLVNRLVQADLARLLAAGLELDIDRLDLELENGAIAVEGRVRVAETGADAPNWPRILLATDADLTATLPVEVVDVLTMLWPQAQTLVALGYLRRDEDNYVVEAGLEDGTIMINGAPMQIPLDAFR